VKRRERAARKRGRVRKRKAEKARRRQSVRHGGPAQV
jgi:hypothetical protein